MGNNTNTSRIRTLYDCYHARYPVPPEQYIKCAKGHKFGSGYVHKRQADREDRLLFRVCQLCRDFEGFDNSPEK